MIERTARTDTTLAWTVKSVPLWYVCVCGFAYAFVMRDALLGPLGRNIVDHAGPAVVGIAGLFATLWAVRNRKLLRGDRGAQFCFTLSMVFALIGLFSVDPMFPAKRIHVPEYFLLAWMVFAAFEGADHLGLRGLVALTITVMLGGLDELLQGAMAARTYGLADMLTNAYGACSGVLAACGMQFLKGRNWGATSFSLQGGGAPLALALGYFLSLAGLFPFKGLSFPLWVLLPIVGGLAVTAKESSVGDLSGTMERFSISVFIVALTALGGLTYVQVMGIRFL